MNFCFQTIVDRSYQVWVFLFVEQFADGGLARVPFAIDLLDGHKLVPDARLVDRSEGPSRHFLNQSEGWRVPRPGCGGRQLQQPALSPP